MTLLDDAAASLATTTLVHIYDSTPDISPSLRET